MNPDLDLLQPYPFERLATLKNGANPPADLPHIALSIGEPKHQPPAFALQAISDNMASYAAYPSTRGTPELREAIADWANRRFLLGSQPLNPERHVLPVNGTREALFAFTQACIDRRKGALVLMPNPFYQIYEGAALLAGASPQFMNCTADNNFLPDFDAVDESTWQQVQMVFVCSPGNPTGSVIPADELKKLIELSDKYDFIIASDECYSELYFDEQQPPVGLLQACAEAGRVDFKNCIVFHSLSKRSNLPGLRSGFVAGDAEVIQRFFNYRTYHGCAMSLPHQLASIAAWRDEGHVRENRLAYQRKFAAVTDILDGVLPITMPDAGFYLWPELPIDDTVFARGLFEQQNVTVLPGSFLARDTAKGNPGGNRVRMALVASQEECVAAAERIRQFVQTL